MCENNNLLITLLNKNNKNAFKRMKYTQTNKKDRKKTQKSKVWNYNNSTHRSLKSKRRGKHINQKEEASI